MTGESAFSKFKKLRDAFKPGERDHLDFLVIREGTGLWFGPYEDGGPLFGLNGPWAAVKEYIDHAIELRGYVSEALPVIGRGERSMEGSKKGGQRSAERPEREAKKAETRQTLAKVLRDEPGVAMTVAKRRVAKQLVISLRTVHRHISK